MNKKFVLYFLVFEMVMISSTAFAHWETEKEINATKKFVKEASVEKLIDKLKVTPKTFSNSVRASIIIDEMEKRGDTKVLQILNDIVDTDSNLIDEHLQFTTFNVVEKMGLKNKSKENKEAWYIEKLKHKNLLIILRAGEVLTELNSKRAIPYLKAIEKRNNRIKKYRLDLEEKFKE